MKFLKRLGQAIADDNLLLVSAGVAFYLFLAMFPALFATVSIYGMVAEPETIEYHIEQLGEVMPGDAVDIISEQLDEIAGDTPTNLGWGAALAILIALWSAGKGAKALIKGLNIAYNEEEKRNFFKVQGIVLFITVVFLLFLILSLALIAILPPIISQLPLGPVASIAADVGTWLVMLILILGALTLIYRYAPSREVPQWKFVGIGSITAAILWLVASGLFAWFASNFGTLNETYGVLAGGVVLLLWLQIAALVILLGAELDNEVQDKLR